MRRFAYTKLKEIKVGIFLFVTIIVSNVPIFGCHWFMTVIRETFVLTIDYAGHTCC